MYEELSEIHGNILEIFNSISSSFSEAIRTQINVILCMYIISKEVIEVKYISKNTGHNNNSLKT